MSLILSTAPHIRTKNTTQRLMLNVIIALLPCAAMGVYYFGLHALLVLCVSVVTAIAAEFIWQKATRRAVQVGDLSAVVTGLLLGLCITPAAPWWMVMIGSAFAVIIVKQLFGGIGDNFLNPALAARAVLLASWPAYMTTHWAVSSFSADAVTSATPLATGGYTNMQLLLGSVPGAIGETCKIAILIGFLYLLITGTITWRIPVVTLASAYILSFILNYSADFSLIENAGTTLTGILSGGLLFGAVFMATDYTTSPMKPLSQVLYAIGIGALTILIRKFGSYPEGVTYAILLMNILTPLLDRFMPQRLYGYQRTKKERKA